MPCAFGVAPCAFGVASLDTAAPLPRTLLLFLLLVSLSWPSEGTQPMKLARPRLCACPLPIRLLCCAAAASAVLVVEQHVSRASSAAVESRPLLCCCCPPSLRRRLLQYSSCISLQRLLQPRKLAKIYKGGGESPTTSPVLRDAALRRPLPCLQSPSMLHRRCCLHQTGRCSGELQSSTYQLSSIVLTCCTR
jgi:hypothetical protein